MEELLDFVYDKSHSPIIKVVGVGGGGGNAVTHMYKEGIHDVSFALCNTDFQALNTSPIPVKIQLGEKGLGAGNRPQRAKEAAEQSEEAIHRMLSDGTEMVFITAGMGGGTGTGAAPVVARISREMGILTVGIVTIPFMFEGEKKILQALDGVDEIGKEVDALLVINNERLREVYNDLDFLNAFAKADDTLTNAAKSIAELITIPGYINLDFADVNTTLKDGGVAVMSSGYGEGPNRIEMAIKDALDSPLLNNNDVYGARKILINLYFSQNSQVKMEEMNAVNKFMSDFNDEVEVIWGAAFDNTLNERVKITILASGFSFSSIPGSIETKRNRQIFSVDKGEPDENDLSDQAKRENRERIKGYYGQDVGGGIKPRQTSAVILALDQMDDDRLIELMEQIPAYNRDVKAMKSTLSGEQPSAASGTTSPSAPSSGENRRKIFF